MKILVLSRGVPSSKYPLNGIFEMDQAKALAGLGHEVLFCGLDVRSIRRRRKYGINVYKTSNLNIIDCNFPLGRVFKVILDSFQWFMFKLAYKKVVKILGRPDIVYAHFGRATGYVALKAKKKYGLDYIITEHDSTVNNDVISKKEKKLLKNIYSSAYKCIAVSPAFCETLKKIYNINFTYIPNIVDVDVFKNVKRQPHVGISLVSVGNLIYGKGMDVALKAFSKTNNISKFTIIGDGEKKQELIELSEKLNIKDRVIFAGRLDRQDIARVFSDSDMFVLTSRSETFGVVYIEAMCAGLPVIATRCGGPEGLFTENEGIYVDVDDINGLADAITYISQNLDKYNSENIRAFCKEKYSPDVVAKKIVSLINDGK